MNCWSCGACCKLVGVCSKLGADNRCTIYDTRPNICRVDHVYRTYESGNMSESDYYIKLEEVRDFLDKEVNGEPVVS
jgi:Fe-S-cluster containining protein